MREVRADVYRRFAAMWANGEPVRNAHELYAVVRAAGIDEGEVSDEWLRSLSREWVYGELDDPFVDERANRIYRRELLGE
jgi:hypothetical protein